MRVTVAIDKQGVQVYIGMFASFRKQFWSPLEII